ncbi:hypothetical protein N8I77_011587 [Diaporthe amygdali]|uniref:Uncharacterized protein n=1 Tax=Phomopsis amygdali TaxID=1214568 RepID=A0AAD9S721_PHOAM|nr:hypothetical protein N8I77_011587 [Diaporthe amygdali]
MLGANRMVQRIDPTRNVLNTLAERRTIEDLGKGSLGNRRGPNIEERASEDVAILLAKIVDFSETSKRKSFPLPFQRGPAPFEKDPSLPHHRLPNTQAKGETAKMVKENDTIAIIIIVLFFVLALISFGIYRLVSIARRSMSVTSGSTSSSSEIIND